MTVSAAAVVTSTTPLWYATRATGVVALVLLTASVLLGVVISVRYATERWPRLVTIGVHRNLSLLVTVFLVPHILTAELDTFAPVGWLAVAVPFLSAYRSLWLGLGTVAADLLVALTVTSLLRARIGHRVWRLIHWASYACWPLAVVHGLGTGTDARQPVVLGLTVVCVVSVLWAIVWRLSEDWPENAGLRVVLGAVTAVLTAVVAGWALTGPLEAGWSTRAGTPTPPSSTSSPESLSSNGIDGGSTSARVGASSAGGVG
jgi:predicted ferric reductase